ncbi:hypothetical protein HNP60_002796 [Sphingobium sp. B1D3A]|uniref:Uncharacterized protein n=1 Tax=Sphingobium lignivorans TaxID=2735886 RepID=A0ABR6NHS0_9SPHN|nr:hypothetical protein [Sphingobium lignivorans]
MFSAAVTPARDALHPLTGEQLVETPQHNWFRVPKLTEMELRDPSWLPIKCNSTEPITRVALKELQKSHLRQSSDRYRTAPLPAPRYPRTKAQLMIGPVAVADRPGR